MVIKRHTLLAAGLYVCMTFGYHQVLKGSDLSRDRPTAKNTLLLNKFINLWNEAWNNLPYEEIK